MAISNDTVIQSALKLAQLKGWEKVSVRMIAKEIGYSTMKIYSDFGSKEQLLYEIQKKGFDQLQSNYHNAVKSDQSPEENLENIVFEHVRFAMDHPTAYELMFDHKFNNCKSEAAKIKRNACQIYLKVIDEIGAEDPKAAFLQLVAILYGYVKISKEFSGHEGDFVESTVRQMVRNFIYGIK